MAALCPSLSPTIFHLIELREQNQPTADNLAVFKFKLKGYRKKKHAVWDIQILGALASFLRH